MTDHLEERLNEFVGHLSDGQRQIVALTTVLAASPDVLLLDEFTTYLDSSSESEALRLVRGAISAGIAVVLADHTAELSIDSTTEVTLT